MRFSRIRLKGEPAEVFASFRSRGFTVLFQSQTGKGWSYAVRVGKFRRVSLSELDRKAVGRGKKQKKKSGGPPFSSGRILLLSYGLRRRFEELPEGNPSKVAVPELLAARAEEILAFDHERGEWWRSSARPERREASVEGCAEKGGALFFSVGQWRESPSRSSYIRMVERARKYIAAGDIYQANIARWFSAKFSGDPFGLYRVLEKKNPSPYAAYLEIPEEDLIVVSSSPELLVSRRGSRLVTRPIAGTYPRSIPAHRLPRDPKERAEHIMLVDLERNDLGRVAIPKTVRVEELLEIEEYSHLRHIVSQVAAEIRPGIRTSEILRAVFPGGTITGTPKVRAMEIIDELEPWQRGLYTGSLGWLSDNGDMELNIIIRTAFIRNGSIHLAAGAGIVADSVPEREAEETRIKAAAFLGCHSTAS